MLSQGYENADIASMTGQPPLTDWPKISVVVPIRNEARFIARTLGYLLQQDYPADRLEILVVDGNSDDGTPDIVKNIAATDPRVRLLSNPRRLSSAARALGAACASGDIVTFVDGHTYIDNDQLFKATASLMAETGLSVLSRPQFLDTPENTAFQAATALARRSVIGHGLDSTIYMSESAVVDPASSGAAYRREVFQAVGTFDERFDACEDVEFNYRVSKAGLRSFTSMKLAVYYYPRATLAGLFRQLKRYGIGRCRLARKHPDSLTLSTLLPFLMLVAVPLLALLSLAWKPFLYPLLGGAAAYLVTILIASALLAARHGVKFFPYLPLIYLAIHLGLGWGFAVELIRSLLGRSVRFDT